MIYDEFEGYTILILFLHDVLSYDTNKLSPFTELDLFILFFTLCDLMKEQSSEGRNQQTLSMLVFYL